jgi:hypothetical protein
MPLLRELRFLFGGRGYKHHTPTVLPLHWKCRTDAERVRNRTPLIFRGVDIATAEFSLALRHFSGRCRC